MTATDDTYDETEDSGLIDVEVDRKLEAGNNHLWRKVDMGLGDGGGAVDSK